VGGGAGRSRRGFGIWDASLATATDPALTRGDGLRVSPCPVDSRGVAHQISSPEGVCNWGGSSSPMLTER